MIPRNRISRSFPHVIAVLAALIIGLPGIGRVGAQDGTSGPFLRGGGDISPLDVNPLVPFRNFVVAGGLAAGATCISDNGFASGGPYGGVIDITGIPPGAVVTEAWLWYVVEDNANPAAAGDPTINGVPIPWVRLGSIDRSPCFTQSRTAVFRADVSCVVTGNGSYVLDGFPSSATGDAQSAPFTEGATMAVIYCNPQLPTRRIVIYDGIDVTDTDHPDHSQTIDGFGPTTGSSVTLLAVIGNGQPAGLSGRDPDNFYFNGTLMEDIFPTEEVLAGSACPNGRNRGWWDLGLYDVSSLVPGGSTSVMVETRQNVDCYSFAAYVLAVDERQAAGPCVQCPATVAPEAGCDRTGWCPGEPPPVCTAEGSAATGCVTGRLEYQWWKDAAGSGTLVRPWSTDPAFTPGAEATEGANTYVVEVRCQGQCCPVENRALVVSLWPLPAASAGPDQDVCKRTPVTLDGSGTSDPGCAGGLVYEWREGAVVVQPWSNAPTWSPPTGTPGDYTYTLAAACAGSMVCESTDDVNVTVRDCPLSVRFAEVGAAWTATPSGPAVSVSWSTLEEENTLFFVVERAASASGPFECAGDVVEARGSGSAYKAIDAAPTSGATAWYRVVEYTSDGRGDESQVVEARRAGTRAVIRSRNAQGRPELRHRR